MMEQYTRIELNRNVGLFNIKENLSNRFWLMLNISILSESFCSVFHAVFCKLLIVLLTFYIKYDKKLCIFLPNFNILAFQYIF